MLLYVFKALKLYSLKFAIAHAQIKIVMLIVLHKDTRKLLNHLKQAQKSISNLANLLNIENYLPLTKANREY